jgi:hypothetical protein
VSRRVQFTAQIVRVNQPLDAANCLIVVTLFFKNNQIVQLMPDTFLAAQ